MPGMSSAHIACARGFVSARFGEQRLQISLKGLVRVSRMGYRMTYGINIESNDDVAC